MSMRYLCVRFIRESSLGHVDAPLISVVVVVIVVIFSFGPTFLKIVVKYTNKNM